MDRRRPIWVRNALAVAPIYGIALLAAAPLTIAPRTVAQVGSLPVIALIEIAFFLSYRSPPPFTPSWIIADIRMGHLQLARPDRMDWVLFWLVLPFGIAGLIALPILMAAGAG